MEDNLDRAYHLAIETFPEDAVTVVKAAIKSGLFRETAERKVEIVRKLNEYLSNIYSTPVIPLEVVQTFNDAPVPLGGFYVPERPAQAAIPPMPPVLPLGMPAMPAQGAKIVLDKPSLVSYLSAFSKHLMHKNIMGWDGQNPDIFFPWKFSHSLYYKATPKLYMKALTEGKLILPRPANGGNEGHNDGHNDGPATPPSNP